jgi:hypothetical protein
MPTYLRPLMFYQRFVYPRSLKTASTSGLAQSGVASMAAAVSGKSIFPSCRARTSTGSAIDSPDSTSMLLS